MTSPTPPRPAKTSPRFLASRHRGALAGLLALAGTLTTGCGDDPSPNGWEYTSPQSTATSLTYVDRTHDEILFVTPTDDKLDLRRLALESDDETVLWTQPLRDGSGLLALSGPADPRQDHVGQKLYVFDRDGSTEPRVLPVPAPFNAVALSPDYRHAVLYFSGEAEGSVLHNANLVAIVDLVGNTLHEMTLQGFGGRLTSVHFPGQIHEGMPSPVLVGDTQRDIVAFLAEGEVILADLAHPGSNQPAVSLSDTAGAVPQATLLRPGNDLFSSPALFVRFSTGSDISMLKLRAKEDTPDEFTFDQSPLTVGPGAADMVFYDDEDVPLFVATDRHDGNLVFTDIRTEQSFEVYLGDGVGRVFLRQHDTGEALVDQAVVWSRDGRSVYTLDLDDIQNAVGRRPTEYKINGGIADLVVLDNDRVLVGAPSQLIVIDFVRDQITPFSVQGDYEDFESGKQDNMLLLAAPGQPWVSKVDLVTLAPQSMLLDHAIRRFHFLTDSATIVTEHASGSDGLLTVTPAATLTRAESITHWGFLAEGLYDRE